jgi:hypothetical protein
MASDNRESKSRVASVLLAVFLSFWTWLYTAEKDWWKFVVGLVVGIGSFFLVFPLAEEATFVFIFTALNCAVWIWSIVDTAAKKDEWYRSYWEKKPSS